MNKAFQALYGVMILEKTQQIMPRVVVKMLCADVLPVSGDCQNIRVFPFLSAISPAVTVDHSYLYQLSFPVSMIVKLVTCVIKDNN